MFVVIKNFLELVHATDCDEKSKFMGSNDLLSARNFVTYMCMELDGSKMITFGLQRSDKKFIEEIFLKKFLYNWILLKRTIRKSP